MKYDFEQKKIAPKMVRTLLAHLIGSTVQIVQFKYKYLAKGYSK